MKLKQIRPTANGRLHVFSNSFVFTLNGGLIRCNENVTEEQLLDACTQICESLQGEFEILLGKDKVQYKVNILPKNIGKITVVTLH